MTSIEPKQPGPDTFWSPIKKAVLRERLEVAASDRSLKLKNMLLNAFTGVVPLVVDAKGRAKVRASLENDYKLYTRLVSELTVTDSIHEECASVIAEQLQDMFELPNLGIVLMGSAAHGGSSVRKLMNQNRSDFDWGFVCDLDLSSISYTGPGGLKEITAFVSTAVEIFSSEQNLDLHSCGAMNGAKLHEKNLASDAALLSEVLQATLFEVSIKFPSRLVFFFQPSYPKRINEKNQEVVLNMLSQLYRIDQKKWELLTKNMVHFWKNIHLIKDKHLTDNYDVQLNYEKSLLEKQSQAEMSKPFEDLLNSTAQN